MGLSAMMKCEICGAEGVIIRRLSRSYGQGPDLLVIENVPTVSCRHCGESYMTAEALHEIERIKRHCRSWAQERTAPVAEFEQA
jgi:YgiT-type zinc finger domain-containing protein